MNKEVQKELMKELKINDIEQKTARELAKIIGIDDLLKLADYFHGDTVMIPKPKSLLIKARNRAIKKEKKVYNHTVKELSEKWELSTESIRKILKESN